MIATLELDRRLSARGARGRLPHRTRLPVTLLALPAVLALIVGAALQRDRHRAAAADRRVVAVPPARAARPPRREPLAGRAGPADPRTRARPGRRVPASLDLLSDRGAVADGDPPHDPAGADRHRAAGRRAGTGVRLRGAACSSGSRASRARTTVDYVGPWALGPALGIVLLALALPAAALTIATLETLYRVLCAITHAAARPAHRRRAGRCARCSPSALGDRTVAVAYWLPDRERFVDEHGLPVELPAPGSGRAWTAVERDGRRRRRDHPRRGAGHHARSSSRPPRRPPRWRSTTSACKADLQARVEELRLSRLRIMEAGDAARRRIERNLHDGAQQQLVALALELRMLKARLKDPAIDELSRTARERAGRAARAGPRHPPRDPHRPRAGAGDPVAGGPRRRCRSTIEVDVPQERLPAPVEAAAYFLVAEALTNVARYAEATSASVEVRRDGDVLVVRGRRRRRRRRRSRRPVAGCAGSTTASRRSVGRWRSTARSAAARGCAAHEIPVPPR